MELTAFKAQKRTTTGTNASRALRNTGQVPVIIYGHGEPPVSISIAQSDVDAALTHGARALEVNLGGQTQQYLIKAVQYDCLGSTPIHLDLARVAADERVKVRVGIELRGVAKGLSEGGVLEQHMADIELECLMTEIPDTLHPFVTELGLGDSLLVKDLEMPKGVIAMTDGDERVATVRALVDEAETDDDAEGEGESTTAEPERIGRVRKDDDDSSAK